MAKDKDESGGRPKSIVSAPSNRVTIAFPFSAIKTTEPSDEMRELASVVTDLAQHVAKLRPSPDTEQLLKRAQSIVARLG